MVTLETGYGITQVVKASGTISQNTIQDYGQPEDQFPVSMPLGKLKCLSISRRETFRDHYTPELNAGSVMEMSKSKWRVLR